MLCEYFHKLYTVISSVGIRISTVYARVRLIYKKQAKKEGISMQTDIKWKQRFSNFKKAVTQLTEFIEKGDLNKFEV